jgi:integrase
VWKYYKAKKGLADSRADSKIERRWLRFEGFAPSPHLTQDNVKAALRGYAEAREGQVRASTVKREQNTIIAALNLYIQDHDLDILAKRPRIKVDAPNDRVALDVGPQVELFQKVMELKDSWKKLALLLMCQTSMINSELMNLRVQDVERSPVLYLRVEKGKTLARRRVVPLVVAQEEILRLVDLLQEGGFVMPASIRRTSESNYSHQLNKLLRKLTGDSRVTTYCLRHTWRSNAERADLSQTWMDRLGGWSTVTNEGTGYGKGGSEFKSNLETAKRKQEEVNSHLIVSKGTSNNVVPIRRV